MRNNNYPDNLEIVANQKIKEKKYWLEKLSGEWTKTSFPSTCKRIKKQVHPAALLPWTFSFSTELFNGLMKLSAGMDVKLYMALAAGLAVLVNKYTGSSDIIVGSPIYKQDLSSKFVNTVLVLRNQLRHHETFKELLLQVRQTIIKANDNCNYPVTVLAKQLGMPYREKDDFPLFDIVILLENIHEKTYIQHINCNIRFFFKRSGEGIEGVLEYNPLLYDRWFIEKMIHHFMQVFQCVLVNLDVEIPGIEIMSGDEKKHILEDFNQTASPYPKDKTIHELFREQASKTPDSVSVVGREIRTGEVLQLTYGELNQKSGQLAEVLRERGVLTDDIVAIMLERSLEMIIGILGILKAGGAYLPIDPGYPDERKQYMLADSGAGMLLTNLPEGRLLHHSSLITHHPGNLAYVIYTSGTGGRPKAILTTHVNVVRVVRDTDYIAFQPGDRVLQLSDYAFDGSVFDIFGALLNGCTLVMVRREDILEIGTLCRLIERERISVFFVTTALFNIIVDVGLESLGGIRKVLFGGERVSVNHAVKALAYLGRNRILHMYGPTETTVYATSYPIDAIDKNRITIPIGAPISNTWIYILDNRFTLVPIGVTGEIYIGGPGVCRGYMNNPELTYEKFLRGSRGQFFQKEPPGRRRQKRYRTGDLGRWLNDGNIEFISRVDHQVKVRGYRIELGEIESRLANYVGIKECTVSAVEDEKGSRYLCAYIVGDEKIEIPGLREYLSQFLPGFMVPGYFVRMERLPLGKTGKIDRSSLPDPRMSPGESYVPPRDELEEKLVEIWCGVLGDVKTIGIDDDFFELGGHSLKATLLAAQVHRRLHVKVPLEVIFKNPTIRELARYTGQSAKAEFAWIAPVEQKEYYPLSAGQRRLYIMRHMGVDDVSYNQFMALVLAGNVQKEKLQRTFRELIRRHESLRTSFEIVEDEPVQRIHPEENCKFQVTNFKLKHIENFLRPFDLSRAPLLRVGLMGAGRGEHILMLDMHHIISDGTSLEIFAREFTVLYSGKELPGLRIQYKDFVRWQDGPAAAAAAVCRGNTALESSRQFRP
jgi:amino acid adenylation domain-containing protein